MLEELRIKDFQRHTKLRVPLATGVTCIVGPTEAGKSAIIRALRWVCQNRPLGEAYVREGAGPALAELVFDGGRKLRRTRGKDTNLYRLDDDEFKAFGNNVPDVVVTALQLADVNFQKQHDAPFWFALSPPEVSRQLNQIVNLGAIDEILGELGGRQREAASMVNVVRARHADWKAQYQSTAYVKAVDAALATVEAAQARHADAGRRRLAVATLSTQAQIHHKVATALTAAVAAGDDVLTKASRAIKARKAATDLRALVVGGLAHQRAASITIPDITALKAKLYVAREKATTANLRLIVEEAEKHSSRRDTFTFELVGLKTKIQELTGGMCPACGRPI